MNINIKTFVKSHIPIDEWYSWHLWVLMGSSFHLFSTTILEINAVKTCNAIQFLIYLNKRQANTSWWRMK